MSWKGFVVPAALLLTAAAEFVLGQSYETKRLLSGVALLRVERPGEEPDSGSGIVLGAENGTAYILTALHVLVGPEEVREKSGWERKTDQLPITVEFYGAPRRLPGKMFGHWDKNLDLAVVTVDAPGLAELDITSVFGIGSAGTLATPYPAVAIGNGGPKDWGQIKTRVRSVSSGAVEIESRLDAGFSGGPLIDTTRHLLIGMLTQVIPSGTVAVSSDLLLARLDSWRIPHHLRRAKISTPMVRVPAGPFIANVEPSTGASVNRREIYLDTYFIDKYEVTVGEFERFVKDTGYDYEPGVLTCNFAKNDREAYPMNCVSWIDAQSYADWAGKGLPTEAQWEKAARGPEAWAYPWGNSPPVASDAGLQIEWPVAVGSFAKDRSRYGVMDMLGNVSEWVADWYQRDFLESLEPRNPTGPPSGEDRVLRGGSYATRLERASLTMRKRDLPISGRRRFDYGFRCVLNER